MSKEILQKESNALDKCDVWSFGVIMFEIGYVLCDCVFIIVVLTVRSSTIPYWDLTDIDVRAEIKKCVVVNYFQLFRFLLGSLFAVFVSLLLRSLLFLSFPISFLFMNCDLF
jgi:hypothetical protein